MEHNKPCLHLVECIEDGAELVEAAEHNGLDQGAEVWKWHELTVRRRCPERQLLGVDPPSASRLWTGGF
jgi:hypothetical protein